MEKEIFTNRFSWKEFIFFDGKSYWDNYQKGAAHSQMVMCHNPEAMHYEPDEVFRKISREDFDATTRVLFVLEPTIKRFQPLNRALERWSTHASENEPRGIPATEWAMFSKSLRAAYKECRRYGYPEIFRNLLDSENYLPFLSTVKRTGLLPEPKAVERGEHRHFQNLDRPLEILTCWNGKTPSVVKQGRFAEIGADAVLELGAMVLMFERQFKVANRLIAAVSGLVEVINSERRNTLAVRDETLNEELQRFLAVLYSEQASWVEMVSVLEGMLELSERFDDNLLRSIGTG